VAYLWTRIVTCKNPNCAATVPLLKHTWLCKAKGRFVALKLMPSRSNKTLAYSVIEATTEKGLGFDPELGSEGGSAVCPFCSTVADADYVQSEGVKKRIGSQLIAVVCTRENGNGKVYLSVDDLPPGLAFDLDDVRRRLADVCMRSGISVPSEPIGAARPSPNARGLSAVTRHGFTQFGELFAHRQQLALLNLAANIRDAEYEMRKLGYEHGAVKAVMTYLGATLDRLADFNSSFCIHNYLRSSGIAHTFGRHALGMVWDFAEANPFNEGSGGWGIDAIHAALSSTDVNTPRTGSVQRGSATNCPWPDATFDAVITDPPYYDNVPYADVSDFFYVWLKRRSVTSIRSILRPS